MAVDEDEIEFIIEFEDDEDITLFGWSGSTLDGAQIGAQLGSTFGRMFASSTELGGNPFAVAGLNTIAGAIGAQIGAAFRVGNIFDALPFDTITAHAVSGVRSRQPNFTGDLVGEAVNQIASLLIGELMEDLELDGWGATMFQSLGTVVTARLGHNLVNFVSNPQADVSTLFSGFSNGAVFLQMAGAVTSYFVNQAASYLASEIVAPQYPEGAIGAQIGSAIGGIIGTAFIPIPFVGAAVGQFLGQIAGTLIGNEVFGDDPTSTASIFYRHTDGEVEPGAFDADEGGDVRPIEEITVRVSAVVNHLLDLSGARINTNFDYHPDDHRERRFDSLRYHQIGNGYFLDAIYRDRETFTDENGELQTIDSLHVDSVWFDSVADLENPVELAPSVNLGAMRLIRGIHLEGGDLLMRVAWERSDAQNATAFATDLQVAHDYRLYVDNAPVINALMAAQPNSAFTLGWTTTLMRAQELWLTTAFIGTGGHDELIGGDEYDPLEGRDGNDRLFGETSNDYLRGEEGNDYLDGGADGDVLDGGVGADEMLGGGGDDTYHVDNASDQVREFQDGGPADLIIATININGLPDYVENLTFPEHVGNPSGTGNVLRNVITGNGYTNILAGLGGNDDLYGYDGDDALTGGAGGDLLDGGAGIDLARYDDAGSWVQIDLGTGNGANGDAAGDGLISIENVYGSAYDDTLLGDSAANHLRGLGGHDTVWGRAGTDYLDGGAGNDDLRGEDGDDVLVGAAGADLLHGGAGYDTARYDLSLGWVQVYLDGTAGIGADAQSDTLVEIEDVWGSDFNDALFGAAAGERLRGRGGNDELQGRDGADYLEGGDGGDTLIGGAGTDTLDGGAGGDTYWFAAGYGNDTVVETTDGAATDQVRLHGLNQSNVALTRSGYDLVITLSNNETLTVRDHFVSTATGVEELRFADETRDRFWILANVPLDGTAGNDSMTGTGADEYLRGLAGDDILLGDAGNDLLEGGDDNDALHGDDGHDTLRGGSGDDFLRGGHGNDTIDGGDGTDTAGFLGARSGFTITQSDGDIVVTGDGTDSSFTSIELLRFSDRDIPFPVNLSLNDIVWQHSSGAHAVGYRDQPGTGSFALVGSGDYDGDGDDDLLWQNENTMVAWEMEAGGYVGNHNLPNTSPGYSVRASGDFNGDGHDDILWRSTSGGTVTWSIEDLVFETNTTLASVSTAYDVVGTFDLDGDGDDDILWRHVNGDVVSWHMQGGNLAYTRSHPNISPASYTLAGAGDFDHDGDADLLWDAVSGSGSNVIWRMQGGVLQSTVSLAPVGTPYSVLGIDDFNDDGTDDILWRHSNGSMVAWQMNNMEISATPSYLAPATPGWTPLRVGEFEL